MADTKISAMTSATSISDSDTLPVIQSGANKRVTKQILSGGESIVYKTATKVTISNDNTEQTLIDFALPANSLGTGNIITGEIYYQLLNNTGSNATFTGKLYYGATSIANGSSGVPTGNIGTSGTNRAGVLKFHIMGDGATGSQDGMLHISHGTITNYAIAGTAAEDSTAAKNIKVTITLSAMSSNLVFVMKSAIVKLTKPA